MMNVRSAIWTVLQRITALLPERVLLLAKMQELVIPMDYGNLRIVAASDIEYHIRSHSAAKEPETVRWIERMPQGSILADIGANVGAYSLIAASLGHSVYAFEPGPANYASLCANIQLNHLGSRLILFAVGLNDVTSLGGLTLSSLQPGAALNTLSGASGAGSDLMMMGWSLDELITHTKLPWPTHIKLDVDGNELKILKGACLALTHCQSVLVEVDELSRNHIHSCLERAGFGRVSAHPIPSTPGMENWIYEKHL